VSAFASILEKIWVETATDQGRMAYIDSELAKRRQGGSSNPNTNTNNSLSNTFDASSLGKLGSLEAAKTSKDGERQPASLGKIQEIDLGKEVRDKNAAMTERARRKAAGEEDLDEEVSGKPKKVRLGPDGKPWRSRKKRRTSEDIRRDALVEAVLSENRSESLFPTTRVARHILWPSIRVANPKS
jgi:hypothetical protein